MWYRFRVVSAWKSAMSKVPPFNPTTQRKLVSAGLSAIGAQQALSAQLVANDADRKVLANLLNKLGAGPNGYAESDELLTGLRL